MYSLVSLVLPLIFQSSYYILKENNSFIIGKCEYILLLFIIPLKVLKCNYIIKICVLNNYISNVIHFTLLHILHTKVYK